MVLYEDQAKKKVSAFLAVLRGLEKVQVRARPFRGLDNDAVIFQGAMIVCFYRQTVFVFVYVHISTQNLIEGINS